MDQEKEEKKDQGTLFPKTLIRSDINLEKWNLFSTRNNIGFRVIERKRTNLDGTTVIQKVSIGRPGSTETLTAQEAKIFYLLLNQWDKAGRNPDGVIHGSFREVYLALRGRKSWEKGRIVRLGDREKSWFEKKLDKMIGTVITYEEAYQTPQGDFLTKESFTLLNRIDLFDRKTDAQKRYFDFSSFTIHPLIIKSILGRNMKPLRLDVIVTLRKEISIILYRFLDLILFDKTKFERNVDELAEDIGLKSSARKDLLRRFREACRELEGRDLSHGRISYCALEETADKKNWKLVIRKSPQLKDTEAPSLPVSPPFAAHPGQEIVSSFEKLPPAEQEKIRALADDIFRDRYKMGGDYTKKLALLDAITEYRQQDNAQLALIP